MTPTANTGLTNKSASTPGRPNLSPAQAADAARQFFGVQATAKELPSDRDRNFRLSRLDAPDLLLKVANTETPVDTLDLQNQVLLTLAASGVASIIPRLQPTLTGQLMAPLPGSSGPPHLTRLLTFLPGRPIAEISPSDTLLRELGTTLGQVDRILAGFSHASADRYLQWDSQHAAEVIAANLDFVDHERQDVLRQLASTASERLQPHLASLRRSVIHNDANDYNVLVTGEGAHTKITGLIDFGDVVHSYTLAEPANCAAYLMLDKGDPIATAAQIARGYHRAYPLNDSEQQALFDLIVTRLCLSAAIGSRQTRQDPANKYLAVSQRPVWALLSRLGGEDYATNAARLQHLIGQES